MHRTKVRIKKDRSGKVTFFSAVCCNSHCPWRASSRTLQRAMDVATTHAIRNSTFEIRHALIAASSPQKNQLKLRA